MSYRPGENHRFSYALAVALGIHGMLVFWVTFSAISDAVASNQKEVTLSIANSDESVDEADFLAQQNSKGSGDLDELAQQTTTSEAPLLDNEINPVDPMMLASQPEQEASEPDRRIITTSGESTQRVNLEPDEEEQAEEESFNDERNDLQQLSREIASLEARLADRQQLFTRKPRILRLTSSSTMAAGDAEYVFRWRNRVEKVGNLHYPPEAREQGLYGDVRLQVRLKPNGIVEETKILSSSGSSILDRAALNSIRLASPFEPFPEAMAEKYDVIEVIRTWQFRKDRLTAESG